ncbi:MAG TPA: hypothetical protein DCP90_07120 [Clostridiales bacterium]|nr:MAG: hypothetical protein A2Y22_02400 [Clostridiales bacterium GWD2_32_59]HAN10367.1 hypothetical protein [Clostridiales bacterium]
MRDKFFLGFGIIAVGVVFLLDAFKIIDSEFIRQFFWPFVLTLFVVSDITKNRKINLFNIALLLVAINMVLDNLGIYKEFNIWGIFWPILLIAIGVNIMIEKDKNKNIF